MAKEGIKARDKKRLKSVERYAAKRQALTEAGDGLGVQTLPRNASPLRIHTPCSIAGRPPGFMRQFGISRVLFRTMASNGLIPGVTKASW